MNTNLKPSLSKNKTLLIISVLCILSSILCYVIGEIMVPILVGLLASLYLFGSGKTNVFGIVTTVAVLAINALGIAFKLTLSFFGPAATILAFILWLAFSKKQSKADASYLMTLIYAVFTVCGFILLAMVEQGEYTLEAAGAFYKNILDSLPPLVTESMNEAYKELGIKITEEDVALIFDQQVKMIICYLFVGSFAIVGISSKVFSAVYSLCAEDKKPMQEWRFMASSIFAYVYPALAIISLFITSLDSVFAISMLNLYVIFAVIFAYIGFNFVWALLMNRMRRGTAFLVLTVVTIVFFTFFIQLLAVIGVVFTIRNNKTKSETQS